MSFLTALALSEREAIEPQASSRGKNHRAPPGRVHCRQGELCGWVEEGH